MTLRTLSHRRRPAAQLVVEATLISVMILVSTFMATLQVAGIVEGLGFL